MGTPSGPRRACRDIFSERLRLEGRAVWRRSVLLMKQQQLQSPTFNIGT